MLQRAQLGVAHSLQAHQAMLHLLLVVACAREGGNDVWVWLCKLAFGYCDGQGCGDGLD